MTWWQFLCLWLTQQGLNYEDDDDEAEEEEEEDDDDGGGGGDNDHEDQQDLIDEMNLKLFFFNIFQILHKSDFLLQIIVDLIFIYCRSIFGTDKLQQQIANTNTNEIQITDDKYKYKLQIQIQMAIQI